MIGGGGIEEEEEEEEGLFFLSIPTPQQWGDVRIQNGRGEKRRKREGRIRSCVRDHGFYYNELGEGRGVVLHSCERGSS